MFGNVANSGKLIFNRSGLLFTDIISGSGSLEIQGTGTATVTLTGTASHTGGTTIAGGTFQIGNGGATGTLTGNVVNNATLTFNRSDNIAFAGNISGSGGLKKLAPGELALSGNNSYLAGTTISAGTLRAASNTALGDVASVVTVKDSALLANSGLSIGNAITVSGTGTASTGLLAFWNFGNSTGSNLGSFNTTGTVEVYDSVAKKLSPASAGLNAATASVDLSGLVGTNGGNTANNFGTITGTSINEVVAGANDAALTVTGTSNNGNGVVYKLSTAGFKNLIATYATQGTGTGFMTQTWSYSTDGTNFTPLASTVTPPASFALETIDFSSISALNDKSAIYLKVTLAGATATSGNNRIDNVQFNALPVEGSLTPASIIGSDATSGSTTYSGTVVLNSAAALTAGTGGTVNFTGLIIDGTPPNGITKIGGGTVALSANNTYTGATNIQAGTLALVTASNNNLATSTNIIVGDSAAHSSAKLDVTQVNSGGNGFHVVSGQTLSGRGTVLGNVTVDAGGFLSPGNTVGTLTAGNNVSLNGTLKINIDETNAAANGALNVTGGLSLSNAALAVNVTGAVGHAIYVISHYGSLTGDPTFATSTGLPTGYSVNYNYLNSKEIALVSYIHGDFNRDGQASPADIPAMLSALTDLNTYKSQNALTDTQLAAIGDFNSSGTVTNVDIQGMLDFIASLPGAGSVAAVPEPGSLLLMCIGGISLVSVRRRSKAKARRARKISLV